MKLRPLEETELHVSKNAELRPVSPWIKRGGTTLFVEDKAKPIDHVAAEQPVALVYNGVSHAVMMASPEDLEDFALGFSLTESIIESFKDVYSLDIIEQSSGIEVQLQISQKRFTHLKQQRRQLMGKTGCGICGIEALQHVKPNTKPVSNQIKVTHSSLQRALHSLECYQTLQSLTGASHAAAWSDLKGNIKLIREDVGRHNALDKLIGARRQSDSFTEGFVVISSRASYEMVQKASVANIEVVVAVSAATTMAIDTADACGVTLIGFGRSERHVVYSGHRRIE